MTVEKRNRIVGAITVNVILLICILAVIVVAQLIEIGLKTGRVKKLKDDIGYYTELIENAEDELDYLKSDEYLKKKAFEYGYRYSN